MNIKDMNNPIVFLDLHSNKQKVGRLTFELFQHACPKIAENFRQFCTGEYQWRGQAVGYKETCFHKIISDKFIQGGDFITNGVNSKPKITIYGYETLIEDESFEIKHSEAGLLSSVNQGLKNSNGNLFRITTGPCPELDGKSTVFGQIVDENSMKIVKTLSNFPVNMEYKPKYPIVIKECGQM